MAAALLPLLVTTSPARLEAAPPPAAEVGAPAPGPGFAAWLEGLAPGMPIRVAGITVVPLERRGPWEPEPEAQAPRVTLRGADVSWLDLPAPAGDLYVRVHNRGAAPLEVTVGEALLSAAGPSRVVQRPAWIAPRSVALVATAPMDRVVQGPYAARGLGLTPRECELLPTPRWRAALAQRNRAYGVDPARLDDASAAYVTDAFQMQSAGLEERLAALEGPSRVGLAVLDERGLSWVRLTPSPSRFARHAGLLRLALALDGLEAQRAGRAPRPLEGAALTQALRALTRPLEAEGVEGTAPGGGTITWWRAPALGGTWEGLSAAGAPLSLTWRRSPPPPPPAAPPPATAAQPPPEAGRTEPPTPNQIGRDPRPTPFEERLRDRREGAGGGERPPLR